MDFRLPLSMFSAHMNGVKPIMEDIYGLSIGLIKKLTDFDIEEIEFMNNDCIQFDHLREMFTLIVKYREEESPESIRYWAKQLGDDYKTGLMALREKNIYELMEIIKRTKTLGWGEWVQHNADLIEMYSEQGSTELRRITSSIARMIALTDAQIDERLDAASAFVGIREIAQYEEPSSSKSLSSPLVASTQQSLGHNEAQSTPNAPQTIYPSGASESPFALPVASPPTMSHFETALSTPLTISINSSLHQYEVPATGYFPLGNYGVEAHPIFNVADIPLPTEPTCIFCSSSIHWSLHCNRYPNNAARMARIKQLGRCYHCLGPFNWAICMQRSHWEQCKCGGSYSCHPVFCKSIDMSGF